MNCCACDCEDGKDTDTIAHVNGPTQSLQFVQAGKSIQHPLKAALRSTNADAFAADLNIIGIADGVSTVEDEGLDPSELPVELLSNCLLECRARMENSLLFDAETEDLLSGCDVEMYTSKFPLYVLTRASAQCTTFGSTTCVLGILEDNFLWSVNIGDSGLIVVRRTNKPPKAYPRPQDFSYATCHDSRARVPNHEDYGGYQIVYRTLPQQHFFNCPYQLARMPDMDCSGEAILKKTAETADVGSFEVQPGDIAILGTDGLFDNVFDDDILDLLNRMCWADSKPNTPPSIDPQVIVDALLDLAVKAGQPLPGVSSPIVTPFSKAAFDEVGRRLAGGKPDDITAVVAYIVPTSSAENSGASCQVPSPHSTGMLMEGKKGGVKHTTVSNGNATKTKECNGDSVNCRLGAGAQLSLLEGFQGKTQHLSRTGCSRSSFPPRVQGATTPANKASIHAVPKSMKAAEFMAFQKLKEQAKQRLQKVVLAGPPQKHKQVENGWVPGQAAVVLNAIRGILYGRQF